MSDTKSIDIKLENLDESNSCKTKKGVTMPCIDLQLCLSYDGVEVGRDIGMFLL